MFKNSARAAAFKNFFFKVRKYISEEWRQEKDPNSIFRALVWWLFLMTLLASLQTLNYLFDYYLYCTTKLCINRLEIVKHWTLRSKRMSPFFHSYCCYKATSMYYECCLTIKLRAINHTWRLLNDSVVEFMAERRNKRWLLFAIRAKNHVVTLKWWVRYYLWRTRQSVLHWRNEIRFEI